MSKEKKKIKINSLVINIGIFIVLAIIGYVFGMISSQVIENKIREDINIFLLITIFIACFVLQGIFHEAGHLVCGLLSRYEFISFRVASITIIKESGKFKIRKFKVPGTGGQCLMMPKSDNYENCPYLLYNLGGVLINALLSIVAFIIYNFFNTNIYINMVLVSIIFSGIIVVITNGIPMKISGIANDGYNIFSIMTNKFNKYCFYTQLRVNGFMSKGRRIKDMPLEWFIADGNADFSNPLVSSLKCLEANYYSDNLEFDKARECYEFLLNYTPKICKLHENEAKCEVLFCEIVGKTNEEKIKSLYTKVLKSYIKSTNYYVSRRRLMYAYTLIIDKDLEKAKSILNKIEKMKKTYYSKSDMESELEIINFVKDNFENNILVI